MKDTFDIGVALAIGFVVGTYFGVWLLDAYRAYLADHPMLTHLRRLSPEAARHTDKIEHELVAADDVHCAVLVGQEVGHFSR